MSSPSELLEKLLRDDPLRWQLLSQIRTVNELYLNAGGLYLAAGAVRNLVWDHLHQIAPTPLNDVDVIFYCPLPPSESRRLELDMLRQLHSHQPNIQWQVKNQALMHLRNGDPAYQDLRDAISYWPEKETAIAVQLTPEDKLEVVAPFGLHSLMAGKLSWNPKRDQKVFTQRLQDKAWLHQWPELKVNTA